MVHQSLEKVEKTTDANYNNLLKTTPKPFKKLKRVKKQKLEKDEAFFQKWEKNRKARIRSRVRLG